MPSRIPNAGVFGFSWRGKVSRTAPEGSGYRVQCVAATGDRLQLGARVFRGLLRRLMFTGIVEETGQVRAFESKADAWSLVIAARAALVDLTAGDSIAVNGCCLTATHFDATTLRFDVLEETRRLTNFSALRPGALVNLERSLRFGGKVGGHFVTGHIDALGTVEIFESRGKDHYLRIRIAPEFNR